MTTPPPIASAPPEIVRVELIIGMEIHVELSTRRKMFAFAPNGAHPEFEDSPPNMLVDATVLALPGALPVMNRDAIERSMRVGLALGCSIASLTKWDRKGYVYPDLPKSYQISQYDLPLCFDGAFDLPPLTEDGEVDLSRANEVGRRIVIRRAHLEEDAGKLSHEAPGGSPLDHSIVDLNRAGTPLLEIVTDPDLRSADEAAAFCKELRRLVRFLGVTEGDMQKGHIRFEPNINCVLTLEGGKQVRTPITEVKNLNSFRAVHGAIEYERKRQPERWRADGLEFGPGSKTTRGWDDAKQKTVVQREKEDAHDYRYFPDPDLPPLRIADAWTDEVRATLPETPLSRMARFVNTHGLSPREAETLASERSDCEFYEDATNAAIEAGLDRATAGLRVGKLLLQSGQRRANERSADATSGTGGGGGVGDGLISSLGITPAQVAELVVLREAGDLGSNAADDLFGALCESPDPSASVREMAEARGLLTVRDTAQLDAWCQEAIDEMPEIAADVRAGKVQAVGRLIGAVRAKSGGSADAKAVRERLLEMLDAG